MTGSNVRPVGLLLQTDGTACLATMIVPSDGQLSAVIEALTDQTIAEPVWAAILSSN